jgi:hypothetical protein
MWRGKAESGKLKIEIDMNADQEGRRKGGDSRGGRVNAVEDNRSPSPGGITWRIETEECLWGHGRELREAGDGVVGKHEIPESGCEFVLHDVGGEWLMPQECPEMEERLKAKARTPGGG